MLELVLKLLLFQFVSMVNPLIGFGPLRVLGKAILFPLTFILVAQNLIAILNHARFLGFIPGFSNLNHNFNHLMYAGDLILVTTASRKHARNIRFCSNLYAQLSGQYPNQKKSEIYFPNWFNKQVPSRICNILNFNHGKTPFTYLGVLNSPNRLTISHFDSMVNCLNAAVIEWGKANYLKLANQFSLTAF